MADNEFYNPPAELVANSNIKKFMDKHGIASYDELLKRAENQEWYWGEVAKDLEWFKPFTKVLDDSKAPFFKWFADGNINITYNCLDRHMKTDARNKVAIIYEPEPENEKVERWTYAQLYKETCRISNAMRKLGVKKGDRVTIWMPMVPQCVIAMLACARIGAIHSVVFSGFSTASLRDRINDAEAVALITSDGAFRRGKLVSLKPNGDLAVKDCPSIKSVIVLKRANNPVEMTPV